MPQSFVSLTVHAVFSTKHREPLITEDLRARLFDYMGGTFRSHDCSLIAAGGMPDHVHLLVSLGKQTSVSDILRDVKSSSSKWVHDTYSRSQFAWQSGYGAFAVSYSNLPEVKRYIANQFEHHRVRSFQEEFIAFLKRHEIQYDERCLWEINRKTVTPHSLSPFQGLDFVVNRIPGAACVASPAHLPLAIDGRPGRGVPKGCIARYGRTLSDKCTRPEIEYHDPEALSDAQISPCRDLGNTDPPG